MAVEEERASVKRKGWNWVDIWPAAKGKPERREKPDSGTWGRGSPCCSAELAG